MCRENIQSIIHLLEHISDKEYTTSIVHLNQSTIGKHVRHITEFFSCFLNGINANKINYDLREREEKLETNKTYTIETLQRISDEISTHFNQSDILFEYNFSSDSTQSSSLLSSTLRELIFCLDHSIHHQALIKVALIELKKEYLVKENFGMAYSTIRHNLRCAQ